MHPPPLSLFYSRVYNLASWEQGPSRLPSLGRAHGRDRWPPFAQPSFTSPHQEPQQKHEFCVSTKKKPKECTQQRRCGRSLLTPLYKVLERLPQGPSPLKAEGLQPNPLSFSPPAPSLALAPFSLSPSQRTGVPPASVLPLNPAHVCSMATVIQYY